MKCFHCYEVPVGQCIWGGRGKFYGECIYYCRTHWDDNWRVRPEYMTNPVLFAELATEADFWKELYDQGEDSKK